MVNLNFLSELDHDAFNEWRVSVFWQFYLNMLTVMSDTFSGVPLGGVIFNGLCVYILVEEAVSGAWPYWLVTDNIRAMFLCAFVLFICAAHKEKGLRRVVIPRDLTHGIETCGSGLWGVWTFRHLVQVWTLDWIKTVMVCFHYNSSLFCLFHVVDVTLNILLQHHEATPPAVTSSHTVTSSNPK